MSVVVFGRMWADRTAFKRLATGTSVLFGIRLFCLPSWVPTARDCASSQHARARCLDTCREIRHTSGFETMPVIACSALDAYLLQDREEGM